MSGDRKFKFKEELDRKTVGELIAHASDWPKTDRNGKIPRVVKFNGDFSMHGDEYRCFIKAHRGYVPNRDLGFLHMFWCDDMWDKFFADHGIGWKHGETDQKRLNVLLFEVTKRHHRDFLTWLKALVEAGECPMQEHMAKFIAEIEKEG